MKITAPIGAIIAQYFGIPITPNLLSQIRQQLRALMDGKWEYTSETIWYIERIKDTCTLAFLTFKMRTNFCIHQWQYTCHF
ncbi:hypothetical protein P7D01_26405 [Bacillus paranthracis]|nr:hypothetical protein [Bacillus paranthracis]